MKKIIKSIIVASSLLIGGCTSLDLAPVSSITDANYWKTSDHYTAFMNGIQARLRDHSYAFFLIGEGRSDMFLDQPFGGEAPQGMEVLPYNTINEPNPGVSNYGSFYSNINQINLMIAKTIDTDIVSDAERTYYLGQLYGLRAFYYFHIIRTWGDAIISTEPTFSLDVTNLAKAASPKAEIITLIKADIDASTTSFGTNYTIKGKKGFWSKAATLMLKGEVYLWSAKQEGGGNGDATIAKNALSEIQTNNTELGLEEDFSDVFNYENKGNKEIIFAIRNQLKETSLWNGNFGARLLPQRNYLGTYYDAATGEKFDLEKENRLGLIQLGITKEHLSRFSDDDSRLNYSLKGVYNLDTVSDQLDLVGVFCYKYQGTQEVGSNSRSLNDDYPIYRYADLLLLIAEAKVMLGEDPKVEINEVRARAYGDKYDEATVGYPNQDIDGNAERAILEERFKEFMVEGKRWYDLRRFGSNYVFEFTLAEEDNLQKLLWPVDKNTLTKNTLLKQTPGY